MVLSTSGLDVTFTNSPAATLEMALLKLDRLAVYELLAPPLEPGETESLLADSDLAVALDRIGERWQKGEVALAQVYMAARLAEDAVEQTIRERRQSSPPSVLRYGIGVLHDHHSLGKRIVLSVLRAAGYQVTDFGQGLSNAGIASKAVDCGVDVLLISSLLLSSARSVGPVREELRKLGSFAKIVVGGPPHRFDHDLWREVGADAVGFTGTDAVRVLRGYEEAAK